MVVAKRQRYKVRWRHRINHRFTGCTWVTACSRDNAETDVSQQCAAEHGIPAADFDCTVEAIEELRHDRRR